MLIYALLPAILLLYSHSPFLLLLCVLADNARVASVLKRVEQLLKIGKPFQRSNFAGDATAAGAGSGGAGGHSSVSSADAGRVGAGGREGVLYGQNPSYPDHVPLRPPALTPLQMQEQARNHRYP